MSESPTNHNSTPIVYVRQVNHDELPDELRGQLRGVETQLYSVHDAEGNRLAMVQNRKLAFALAKQNDMVPLSVH